ncbi:alpha/beta fold hydrolase [Paenibacillus marinisediminis]
MKRYKSRLGQELIHESYDQLLAAWGVAYEQVDIPSVYGKTHIITAGVPTNPPLLLLHGMADHSAMMWIYSIQQLSEMFYVIAIDIIGGSGKSVPNDRYAKELDQTVWLDEVLEAMNVDSTFIAGVSYGAFLAYHYAIFRPLKVMKIVCIAGVVASCRLEVMFKMMKAFLPETLFPTDANCKRLLRKLSGPNYSAIENNPELMKHWYYLNKYFNKLSMRRHMITIFSNEQIKLIRDKSLFLIGEHDILSCYPMAINKLNENQLNYKIVKQAGHTINHEKSDEVNTEIISYFLS